MENTIKAGDIVLFKFLKQKPQMFVQDIVQNEDKTHSIAHCVWFDKNDAVCYAKFKVEFLVLPAKPYFNTDSDWRDGII